MGMGYPNFVINFSLDNLQLFSKETMSEHFKRDAFVVLSINSLFISIIFNTIHYYYFYRTLCIYPGICLVPSKLRYCSSLAHCVRVSEIWSPGNAKESTETGNIFERDISWVIMMAVDIVMNMTFLVLPPI